MTENLVIELRSLSVVFADGSKVTCEQAKFSGTNGQKVYRFSCGDALVSVEISGSQSCKVIRFSASSLKDLNHKFPLEIDLCADKPNRAMVLTTHKEAAKYYSSAFGYYNRIAVDKEPRSLKPPDNPEYPPALSFIEHEDYVRSYPCWAYPVFLKDFEEIPCYSIFLLADYGNKYLALLTLTDKTTAYLWPGLRLKIFSGRVFNNVDKSCVASLAVSNDPYKAVEDCVNMAASFVSFKPRGLKKKPVIIDKIGWCSWNALLTEDLSHENIIKIVSELVNRGFQVGWVIIDDGWQDEVSREDWSRRALRRLSANKRFPEGIGGVARVLKDMGVELVGLWHTINIHWGGFEDEVLRELGGNGFFSRFVGNYVPSPSMGDAFNLYNRFFSWVKDNCIDFVKIDNQWVLHALYSDAFIVGDAARNIEVAMQAAAYANGLDILNCMCMAPENYSNFVFSNVMRVSMDYIPFWKGDAKLHTIFSIYNALLFSHIAYPDYDMFMSYDPYARVHAVARIFSGGPVYITDRHAYKTDIDLLKRFVLPDGRLVRVDRPALPTRDSLFRDPYNDRVLLKIASETNGSISIAAFNVNKGEGVIEDYISLNSLPFPVRRGDYAYYKAFSGEAGLLRENEDLKISLGELEVEAINLVPVEDDKAVIGLKEYILPRFPIRTFKSPSGKTIVEALYSGILLYYANGSFNEAEMKEGSSIEI